MGLKNTYWLLRHGRSKANEAGIIISKKENGVKLEYALTDVGREQATQAGQLLRKELEAAVAALPDASTDGTAAVDVLQLHVYCSPFSRTIETATLAAAQAGLLYTQAPRFQIADALVERDFGAELEGKTYHGSYEKLWEQDALSMDSKAGTDGESLHDVATRIRALFKELESKHSNAHLLLVAHGDTLSILQAAMEDGDARVHRKYTFDTAELRRLGSGPPAALPGTH